MRYDEDFMLLLDPSVAARRFVLIDEASGELGADMEMTPGQADEMNIEFRRDGVRWRWFAWPEREAA